MKTESLPRLISTSESITVEWKPSLSQINEIINSISAFSNSEGGKIFVGVSNSGQILGVQIGKNTIENLANQISQHTDPKVHPIITTKKIDDREIIIIEVKKSPDKLTLAFGRPYTRAGKSSMKMGKDEYENLILEKHRDKLQFDSQICRGAKLKDIDPSKVRWFLERAKEARGFDVPIRISIKETLERLELLDNGKLTNTAILLFGKRPQKFFVQAIIRCGRLKGSEGHDFIDMKVLEGAIPELRENAMRFITEHIKHAVYFDQNQRYDKWEYPLRAIEEAITNALAHRDYFSNSDIQLAIYDDRIEIWNPGELPKPLKPDDLKKKHRSIPRNKLLARQLFLIKHIERWGMGTNRIVEEMKQDNLPEPEFQNLSGGFEVVLTGPGKVFQEKIDKEKLHKLDINDRQKKALEYIKKNGSINRQEYCKINNIGDTYAKRELGELIQKKIIKRVGKGKNTRYVLVTE